MSLRSRRSNSKSGGTRQTLNALVALITLWSRDTLIALRTNRTVRTIIALWALVALITLWSRDTLIALISLVTLWSLISLVTLNTRCTSHTVTCEDRPVWESDRARDNINTTGHTETHTVKQKTRRIRNTLRVTNIERYGTTKTGRTDCLQ